jgi:hypothetical protein
VIAIGTLSSTYASASATPADKAAAVLAANLLSQISMGFFPIILIEAGIVGFSVAMVNSRTFGNWVADVGVASALVGILTFGITTIFPSIGTTSFVSFLLFLAYLALVLVWVFGCAGYLLRAARPAPIGAPAPT